MLRDIIFNTNTVEASEVTRLLPYDFFRKYIPLSLIVEDSFDLRGHIPIDIGDLTPRRVIYLDDIDCYLVLNIGNPHMPVLYLIDGQTHEIRCSYTYMMDLYPEYQENDQIVDVCVHHTDIRDKIPVTFLIINNTLRRATLVTFNLEYAGIGLDKHGEGNLEHGPIVQLSILDMVHFADVIPPGKYDEIALGYEEATIEVPKPLGGTKTVKYPRFLLDNTVSLLKDNLFMGELIPKYCTLTMDEKNQFIILLGTRIKCWVGPFLGFPIDAQYVIVQDSGGMNQLFKLMSPTTNAVSWDERVENQPYKYSISCWDGKYLLCLEDRKTRYLNPLWTQNKAYGGGVTADRYYPVRSSTNEEDEEDGGDQLGYVTSWDSSSYLEPVYREAVWVTLDICDLFDPCEPVPPAQPPYKADIIFLIDDSQTMDRASEYGGAEYTPFYQLKSNVDLLVERMVELGVGNEKNDVRYGVVSYQNNIHAFKTTVDGTDVLWAPTYADLMDLLNQYCVTNEETGEVAWTERDRGRSSPSALITTNIANLTDVAGALDKLLKSSQYGWRKNVTARFIVLVTDTVDEVRDPKLSSPYKNFMSAYPSATYDDFITTYGIDSFKSSVSPTDVIEELKEQGITMVVVAQSPAYYNAYIKGTDGLGINMKEGGQYNWGTMLAQRMAPVVVAKAGSVDVETKDWWSHIAGSWGPVVYYHYTPANDFEHNSLITVFHDDIAFMVNGAIVRNKINWLTCFDNYPALGGEAQDSFYLPGLIPNEEQTQIFIIRNESYTGIMKKMDLKLLDVPDDITVTITNFPEQLYPRKTAAISVTAKYSPIGGDTATPPARHIDVHYLLSYWLTHSISCNPDIEIEEEEIITPPMPKLPDLYFVESNQKSSFTSGYNKEISFDPLYTLSYVTETDYKEDDLTEQESWTDRLYILTKEIVNSASFERVTPVPMNAIAGYDTSTTGCCWLKVRGPVIWTTTRKFTCKVNTKTWYLVNQSTDKTYIAHPVMNPETAPNHKGMGFMLFEYPDGNIIPPGEARAVTIKWQPIFNPAGEEMTKKTTHPAVHNCQTDAVGSIWSTEDGFFNSLLYGMAVGRKNNLTDEYTVYPDYGTKFTHTYIETIEGDGIDIPVKSDQALQKLDAKRLIDTENGGTAAVGNAQNYATQVYLDVDVDQVEDGFQFLKRAGIWMGCRYLDENGEEEPDNIALPLGAKPSDMFTYTEWISPASGLESLPQYIDHKFQINPLYTFNAGTDHPYQLAPFNKQYADPYMATLYMGKHTIKTSDVAFSSFESINKYNAEGALLIPCDALGNEQAGWLLEQNDIWPVPLTTPGVTSEDARRESISILATENDYIFTKRVYVKNIDTVPHQIVLDYDANVINGVSVQGVNIISNPLLPAGSVGQLEVSFRLHYTYQESKCVNLVKQILYIPVFTVEGAE